MHPGSQWAVWERNARASARPVQIDYVVYTGLALGFLPWHIECVVKYIKHFDLYNACCLLNSVQW